MSKRKRSSSFTPNSSSKNTKNSNFKKRRIDINKSFSSSPEIQLIDQFLNISSLLPSSGLDQESEINITNDSITIDEMNKLRSTLNVLIDKAEKYDKFTAHTSSVSNCVKTTNRDIYFYLMGKFKRLPREWEEARKLSELQYDKDYFIYKQLQKKFAPLDNEMIDPLIESTVNIKNTDCINHLLPSFNSIPKINVESIMLSLNKSENLYYSLFFLLYSSSSSSAFVWLKINKV